VRHSVDLLLGLLDDQAARAWVALQLSDMDFESFGQRMGGADQGRLAGFHASDGRAADADLLGKFGLGDAALDAPMD
jgi:hypothetical protein